MGDQGQGDNPDEVQEEVVEDVLSDIDQLKYRMDVTFSYAKLREDFGRPTMHFRAIGPVTILERRPDENKRAKWVKLNPVPRSTQTDFIVSKNYQLTDKTTYLQAIVTPWSKDEFDTESAARLRKKMLKEEELLEKMPSIHRRGDRCCIQNSSINIYESYFEPPYWDEPDYYAEIEIKKISEFEDFCDSPARPVQCIRIDPHDSREFAAAYSFLTYRRHDFIAECECYVWHTELPHEPLATLVPTVPVVSLDYNPRFEKMLLGGLITGQLCYWDLRASTTPAAFSNLYHTFREPPNDCLWTHSKTGYDCFATSSDGQIIWYDVRNFKIPVEKILLDFTSKATPSFATALAPSALEFEPTIPTKFMVGLETGSVLVGNRKGKTVQEKFTQPYYAFPYPVKSLMRNPTNLKCFLCVGGYEFRVFAEDCKESYIFWSPPHSSLLTTGVWSPTKHSVFYITRRDGGIEVWDLLQNVDRPVLNEELGKSPLISCQIHENGKYILTGGEDGIISLLEVSSHFYNQDKQGRALVAAMFERGSKREKLIDARNREVRLHQRMKEKGSRAAAEIPEEDLKRQAREEFIKSLATFDAKKMKVKEEEN